MTITTHEDRGSGCLMALGNDLTGFNYHEAKRGLIAIFTHNGPYWLMIDDCLEHHVDIDNALASLRSAVSRNLSVSLAIRDTHYIVDPRHNYGKKTRILAMGRKATVGGGANTVFAPGTYGNELAVNAGVKLHRFPE